MKLQIPSTNYQTNNKKQIQNSKGLKDLIIGNWDLFGNWKLGFENLREAGFTLVEMLAVMVVFVSIGGIVVSILVTSFRTSHKTDSLTLVKQNGNYALTQMAKTIRNARALITPYPCYPSPVSSNSISVTTSDDQNITYSCTGTTIASNSASLLDTTAVTTASCSFTCTQQFVSDLPFITINFSLNQVTSSSFTEQKASSSAVPFQTSVLIRNINR